MHAKLSTQSTRELPWEGPASCLRAVRPDKQLCFPIGFFARLHSFFHASVEAVLPSRAIRAECHGHRAGPGLEANELLLRLFPMPLRSREPRQWQFHGRLSAVLLPAL